MKLVGMFVLIKSGTSLKMGGVWCKTRSIGQILEKTCVCFFVNFLPCVCSRGHLFSPIIMKLGQDVCLHKISEVFEIRSCGVKN